MITRVVDYGGLFHDDVLPDHEFADYDHRKFRPDGWVEAGREKLERMRPFADRHGLTMLQLACAWNLGQPGGALRGADADPGERRRAPPDRGQARRAGRAGRGRARCSSAEEVRAIRAIGENTGCMALKGASLEHEGPPRPDRWALDEELAALAERWGDRPRSATCSDASSRRASADERSER